MYPKLLGNIDNNNDIRIIMTIIIIILCTKRYLPLVYYRKAKNGLKIVRVRSTPCMLLPGSFSGSNKTRMSFHSCPRSVD